MRLVRLLKKDLAREMADWVDEDLLTASQAQVIAARYGVDFERLRSQAPGYGVLVILGYLFLGLALIILIGANWQEIPRAVRMSGLIMLTAAVNGLGLYQYARNKIQSACGYFFLGLLCFGASIILIAQIYHLGEHMPNGLFLWALGGLPFAVVLRDKYLMFSVLLLATIWCWVEYHYGYMPWRYLLFLLASLYVLYHIETSFMLFLTTVASVGFWLEIIVSFSARGQHWNFPAEQIATAISIGLAAFSVSMWLQKRNGIRSGDYGVMLEIWSLRLLIFILLVLSFEPPWLELLNYHWADYWTLAWVMAGLLLISVVFGWQAGLGYIVFSLQAVYILVCVIVALHSQNYLMFGGATSVVLQVACNLGLIVAGVILIVSGAKSDESGHFFLGIGAILLTGLARYFNLVGDYIGGAVLFSVMAVVLLLAARYWKNRDTAELSVQAQMEHE